MCLLAMLAMSEVVSKSATKCVGNRSMNAKFSWGTYRGTVEKYFCISFVFNVSESLGGNQHSRWLDSLALP
jgi:hypothetical protein